MLQFSTEEHDFEQAKFTAVAEETAPQERPNRKSTSGGRFVMIY